MAVSGRGRGLGHNARRILAVLTLTILVHLAASHATGGHGGHGHRHDHDHGGVSRQGRGWECAHDAVKQPTTLLSRQEYPNGHGEIDPATGRRQVSSAWRPIRIKVYPNMTGSMPQE